MGVGSKTAPVSGCLSSDHHGYASAQRFYAETLNVRAERRPSTSEAIGECHLTCYVRLVLPNTRGMASSLFHAKLSPSHRPTLTGTSNNQVWLILEVSQKEKEKTNGSSRPTIASSSVSQFSWQTKPHTLKADSLLEDILPPKLQKISSFLVRMISQTQYGKVPPSWHAQSHGSLIL